MRRFVLAAAVVLGALWAAPAANAAIPSVFGGTVTCSVDGVDGVRECGTGTSSTSSRSTTPTWDGVPIDVNVAFPPDPGGTDGNYPLIMVFHGYGGNKFNFDQLRRFTDRGYAVFTMTDRGFRESCGSAEAQTAGGVACDDGYIRLMDTRYEVRDAQYFAGELADEELVNPQQVGSVGGSYGGGMSMSLGSLKDRVMLPDGSLVPWTSPVDGKPMKIAAAVPNIPWTDLVNSLVPNGATLDYVADSPYTMGRFGIMKNSLTEGLYTSGQVAPGNYAPIGVDPDADLNGWIGRLRAGEPYDGDPLVNDVIDELTTHHSSYYIDHSEPPAPMLISSGFTDDLFPADEALRYYNRTKTQYPDQPLSLFFGNFGHQRAQNRAADAALLRSREDAWLDFYIKGTGATPFQGVETQTLVCPSSAPSGGPYSAPNWAKIAPGEVRFSSAAPKTITPGAGSSAVGTQFDPVNSGGNPCRTAPGDDQAGTATYRLPTVKTPFTLMGASTVIATINSPTANSQVAARLLDVAPDGTESLVNRALFRPDTGSSKQVFQLHPNGYLFAAGHTPKLELLPRDSGSSVLANYGRISNGQGTVTVSDLQLRLPVLEKAGSDGGYIKAPAAKFVPAGYTLAKEFADNPPVNAALAKGKTLKGKARVESPDNWAFCHATVEVFAGGGSIAKKKKPTLLAKGKATIAGGDTGKVKLKLTKKGRKALAGKGRAKVRVKLTTTEQEGSVIAKRVLKVGKK